MEIEAQGTGVTAAGSQVLAPTGVLVRGGRRTLLAGDPGADGATAVAAALVLTGRLLPTVGRLLVDGHDVGLWGRDDLRRRSAVVDAPGVDEPEPALPLVDAVAEGLDVAVRPARRADARAWLAERGRGDVADVPAREVTPSVRTRVLAEVAALRVEVEALVLVSPDRAGGDPRDPAGWWDLAGELAARGLAVVVVASRTSAALLDRAGLVGADDLRADVGVPVADRPDDAPHQRATGVPVGVTL